MKKKALSFAFLVSSFILLIILFNGYCATGADSSEILNAIKNKYDGFEAGIKDMRLEMEIETDAAGPHIKAEQTVLKKGEKIRVESLIRVPSIEKPETSIFIHDGRNSWVISPERGTTELLPESKAEQFRTEERWWEKVLRNARITGEDKVGEREAVIIEIEDEQGGAPASLWVDKNDLVLLQAESRTADGQNARWVFSEFRKVNSWDMPYRTEMYLGDTLQSTSTIRSFEINQGLSDEVFTPEAARK